MPVQIRDRPDQENSFDALRLIAAFLVYYSHQVGMFGLPEPGIREIGQSFGGFGVILFFAISGYLIARSVLSGKSAFEFFAARALRIYPGLVVCLLFCTLCGLALTYLSPGAYLTSPTTWQFLFGNLVPFFQEAGATLPGVFESANWPSVNGSLWTIKYELFCYAVIALALVAPAKRRVLLVALLAGLSLLACEFVGPRWLPPPPELRFRFFSGFDALWFGSIFAVGSMLAVFETRWPMAPKNIAIVLALIYLALLGRRAVYFLPIATIAALTVAVGISPLLYSRHLRRFGDVSYGFYLYAYPVSNAATTYLKSMPMELVMTVSFLGTLGLSIASWWLVERPALALRRRTAAPASPPSAGSDPRATRGLPSSDGPPG